MTVTQLQDGFIRYEPSTQLTRNRHSICLPCAREMYPEIVDQVERYQNYERDKTTEFCCYCGWLHASGIYLETEELNSDMTCNNNHRAAPQDEEGLDSCVVHKTTRMSVIEILVGLVILAIGAITAILWMAFTK